MVERMADHAVKLILKVLEDSNRDLNIGEIAQLTHLSRNTVSKYVFFLERSGKIKATRKIGLGNLYTIAKQGIG